jgi:hypothetical protein
LLLSDMAVFLAFERGYQSTKRLELISSYFSDEAIVAHQGAPAARGTRAELAAQTLRLPQRGRAAEPYGVAEPRAHPTAKSVFEQIQ